MRKSVRILVALPLLASVLGPLAARGLEDRRRRPAAAVLLKVGGEVPHPLTLTALEFAVTAAAVGEGQGS